MNQGGRSGSAFRASILKWGAVHGRKFPWRETVDPYAVLVAEMMLRRTRAEQVSPVFTAFLKRYPTPAALADADESNVSALLWPLGLRWRIPAFTAAARCIVEDFGGKVPPALEDLMSLPGVGDYVARAVRCFAFSEREVVVDTNTVRVAGKYFGFEVGPESRRNETTRNAVAKLVSPARPREGNLALIDFASAVCRPGRPNCDACPVSGRCDWRQSNAAPKVAVGEPT